MSKAAERSPIETAKGTYGDEPMAIATIEQCICLQCEGTIRPEHVLRRSLHGTGHLALATRIEAYCQHCDAAYAVVRVLKPGGWATHGQVSRVTDPSNLARIKAAADQKAGVIQLDTGDQLGAGDEADMDIGRRVADTSEERRQTSQRRKPPAPTSAVAATQTAKAPTHQTPDPFDDPDAQPDPARLAAEIDLHRRDHAAA
jgi:hypothetical protein